MFKKFLLAAVFGCTLAFAGEYWNIDNGGVTMKFLSMNVAPRTTGLSGAGVAMPVRASEVTRNPLAMSTVDEAEFGVNQIIFNNDEDNNFTSAYFALPIGNYIALSLAFDFLGYDELEGRDDNGLETGEFGAYAWNIQAGVGSRTEIFNWGVNLRVASQAIEDSTYYAFLADIAGSFRLNKYFAFGASFTNFGFAPEDEYAPMALQAGITGSLPLGTEKWILHVSADTYRRADTDAHFLFGGELAYSEALMLRLGYAIRTDNDTDSGISCGLGLQFGMIVFDYGYSPRPAFDGANHHLTLGIKF